MSETAAFGKLRKLRNAADERALVEGDRQRRARVAVALPSRAAIIMASSLSFVDQAAVKAGAASAR